MFLIDPESLVYDENLLGEVKEQMKSIYRRILYDRSVQRTQLFRHFIDGFFKLEDVMKMKNAQQEALNRKEAELYLKHMHRAFDGVLRNISDMKPFRDHADVIELHRLVDPDSYAKHPEGYRHGLLMVGKYSPPEPERLYSLMDNLFYLMNQIKEPAIKAFYMHHELVRIHPFTDGNGRTARMVKNWILMYDLYPPIFINTLVCRDQYIFDLENSFRELVRKPGEANEHTMNFFNNELERLQKSVEFLADTLLHISFKEE